VDCDESGGRRRWRCAGAGCQKPAARCPPGFPAASEGLNGKQLQVIDVPNKLGISMSRIACVAIVKNEERHIAEWIAYQFAIGFDAIILMDNLSLDGTKANAVKLAETHDIRIIDSIDTGETYQRSAYSLAIEKFGAEFEWMAFFDVDEFLVLDAQNIKLYLKHNLNLAAIGVNWAIFGSSGHKAIPSGFVTENYLHRSAASFDPNRHIKSIIQPRYVQDFINGHMFKLFEPYQDLEGNPIIWETPGLIAQPPTYRGGKLHHYFTRSWQNWLDKLNRGYPDLERKICEFEAYDRNEIFDDSARRFIPFIREFLQQSHRHVGKLNNFHEKHAKIDFSCEVDMYDAGYPFPSNSPSHQPDRNICNLSLNKSATQSSISPWSRSATIEADASGAINGIINGQYKFHTNIEDSPWWMIDLEQICGIAEVKIYNRFDDPDLLNRASRLKIEIGIAFDQFVEFFRKESNAIFGGVDGNPLVWIPSIPVPGRFVRITLLDRNYLHLDQVEIYGSIFEEGSLFTKLERDRVSSCMKFLSHNVEQEAADQHDVTVVITSCGRYDLLEKTLQSFRRYNTYPYLKEIIVVEDGEGNPIEICKNHGAKLVRVGSRMGQSHAIDFAYSHVNTEYIFHCEDDWEFYNSGFIEKSLNILKYDLSCICVWIRSWEDTNGHPLVFRSKCERFGVLSFGYGEWHGFTWNPSLRRLSDYLRIGHFSKEYNKERTLREPDVGQIYYELGYRAVILDKPGYVRHIGWDRHIH
jgi:hypothetical protein